MGFFGLGVDVGNEDMRRDEDIMVTGMHAYIDVGCNAHDLSTGYVMS